MKIMKTLMSTILISLIAGTAFAEDVNRTVDAAKDGHVEVSNISGEIRSKAGIKARSRLPEQSVETSRSLLLSATAMKF